MSEIQNKRRSSVSMRGFGVSTAETYLNKLSALSKGKRVMETVPNPNTAQTNKPFIRIQAERKYK